MRTRRLSRRALLRGLGASSMLLPILNTESGQAAVTPDPKRLIVLAVPNGLRQSVYWPSGGELDFKIATDAEVPADERYSPLVPLIPHRQDILLVGGLKLQNGADSNGGSLGGHAALPFLLTGARGVAGPEISDGVKKSAALPSVDRFIGKELAKRHNLRFESLVIKAIERFRGNDGFLSFDGPPIGDAPNAPAQHIDPLRLFGELFGSVGLDPAALQQLRARKKSVLDLVGRQIEGFSHNLGSEDRERVQKHLDAVRAVERQVDLATPACVKPVLALDPSLNYTSLNANPNTPAAMKAHMQLVVAAMACDVTRVASLLWPDSVGNFTVFHWLGPEFTKPGTDFANAGENRGLRNHHEIAHRDGEAEYKPLANRVCQWYLEQLAYLIQLLKDTKDPSGARMLDNTVVLLANMQRTGGGHHTDDLPWILAGNSGGYFKTGRMLRWASGKEQQNKPQNCILAALCNALDVPV
ncbi:MAG TPA: DUF1552 domain-containing protein, partial [Polyangiaceae bacterium]|nr:DUF1552 domain-containing protein [Polyangiaceae bacterium]